VKYAFIKSGKCTAPLTKQFDWLSVSSSGYYDWLSRDDKPVKRAEQSSVIDEAIRIAYEDRKQRYGSPRLHVHLNKSGFPVALNTVAESMRRQGLVAKAGRKFKATTNSAHNLPVSPNLLEQDFTCQSINEKWAGDITYLWTDEGWLYLAVVLDLFSRRIIGWSMNERMTKQLACDAMQMAIDQRTDFAGVIMHTDRGSQYCSKKFQGLLSANDIRSSMSKKGDCYDNACSESFFHTLKVEAIHGELFPTRETMREVVFEYIETDYNRTRHHTTIGNTSPFNYEMAIAA
jgi:transposase InsO family protein